MNPNLIEIARRLSGQQSLFPSEVCCSAQATQDVPFLSWSHCCLHQTRLFPKFGLGTDISNCPFHLCRFSAVHLPCLVWNNSWTHLVIDCGLMLLGWREAIGGLFLFPRCIYRFAVNFLVFYCSTCWNTSLVFLTLQTVISIQHETFTVVVFRVLFSGLVSLLKKHEIKDEQCLEEVLPQPRASTDACESFWMKLRKKIEAKTKQIQRLKWETRSYFSSSVSAVSMDFLADLTGLMFCHQEVHPFSVTWAKASKSQHSTRRVSGILQSVSTDERNWQ